MPLDPPLVQKILQCTQRGTRISVLHSTLTGAGKAWASLASFAALLALKVKMEEKGFNCQLHINMYLHVQHNVPYSYEY